MRKALCIWRIRRDQAIETAIFILTVLYLVYLSSRYLDIEEKFIEFLETNYSNEEWMNCCINNEDDIVSHLERIKFFWRKPYLEYKAEEIEAFERSRKVYLIKAYFLIILALMCVFIGIFG